MKSKIAFAFFWAAVVVSARGSVAEELVARSQPTTGVLEVAQPITWQIKWTGDKPPEQIRYRLEHGGRTEIEKGSLQVRDGHAELTASLDISGSLLAHFAAAAVDGQEHRAIGGAIVSPAEIKPSAPRPADFDAFWDAKIQEIAAVPFNVQLEKAESGRDDVDYWKITLDGYRGTKIRGQLARPAASKMKEGHKQPAMFIPQWAGVYPLEKGWVTDRASQGWLVLNILAHDLPIDEPAEFYEQQAAGPLQEITGRSATMTVTRATSCGCIYLAIKPSSTYSTARIGTVRPSSSPARAKVDSKPS